MPKVYHNPLIPHCRRIKTYETYGCGSIGMENVLTLVWLFVSISIRWLHPENTSLSDRLYGRNNKCFITSPLPLWNLLSSRVISGMAAVNYCRNQPITWPTWNKYGTKSIIRTLNYPNHQCLNAFSCRENLCHAFRKELHFGYPHQAESQLIRVIEVPMTYDRSEWDEMFSEVPKQDDKNYY